jgi:hypothetical protein
LAYDLLITRADPAVSAAEPISRHVWLSLAVATPALMQKRRPPYQPDDDVEYPAFSLLGYFGRPVLFWRDGAVVVKQAEDEYLPDLRIIAARLGARLLARD